MFKLELLHSPNFLTWVVPCYGVMGRPEGYSLRVRTFSPFWLVCLLTHQLASFLSHCLMIPCGFWPVTISMPDRDFDIFYNLCHRLAAVNDLDSASVLCDVFFKFLLCLLLLLRNKQARHRDYSAPVFQRCIKHSDWVEICINIKRLKVLFAMQLLLFFLCCSSSSFTFGVLLTDFWWGHDHLWFIYFAFWDVNQEYYAPADKDLTITQWRLWWDPFLIHLQLTLEQPQVK